jgi:hypothetical protein
MGRVPARVEIDLAADSARWCSLMGTEVVDLSATSVPARTVF